MSRAAAQLAGAYERHVMNTYVRSPLALTKGKGSRVWDIDGHEYLDLFPGWGVSALGHNHPFVVTALRGQAGRLMHVANTFYHPLQAKAARKLASVAFDGKVFFCNSGAEGVETAIKLARKWGHSAHAASGGSGARHEIIVMDRSFHGRTMGALSATGQTKYQKGFEPLVPGFVRAPFNDLQAVEQAVTEQTVAILVEPIQGEGGLRIASDEYLRGLRALCDTRRLLLIFDEVQTGMGRTGRWFGYQHAGVVPDAMILAKALGGGFPIAAVIAKHELADALTPGTHATTYGGSPLGCACVLAVFEAIEKQNLLERARQFGELALARMQVWARELPGLIKDVRGRGLMLGLELRGDGRPVVAACRDQRVLINCTQETVLRMLPAMTITRAQLDRGLDVLESVLRKHAAST